MLISFFGHTEAQSTIQTLIKGKKILFLGNSITYSGQYVAMVETVLKLRHPDLDFECINAGLPSETVSGLSEQNHAGGRFARPDLHERLQRVLTAIKPDLVVACYGMNDGIYLPFDEHRFQKFKSGINWLHKQVIKSGATIIHLTPPLFDERKGSAYANVLDIYSDWLISCKFGEQWKVIDLHWPMRKYLENKREVDSTFVLANDGIHPNEQGHWLMAKQVLAYLGEKKMDDVDDFRAFISAYPHGEKIYKLTEEKMNVLKDAWLTSTGHKRPEMNKGMPLKDAQIKARNIALQISDLIK